MIVLPDSPPPNVSDEQWREFCLRMREAHLMQARAYEDLIGVAHAVPTKAEKRAEKQGRHNT